jgi:hypothetical protein
VDRPFCAISADALRFFAYGDTNIPPNITDILSLAFAPRPELRIYEPTNRFARKTIRAIYWEIDVRFPKSQAQITIVVDGTRYSPSMVPGEIRQSAETSGG